ncbi:MAG: hypothetical protein CMJ18_18260 [Phycisphaeraceae bacterium]|nr:hypothetical protein [Phycisphaeraceae bacterium]
MIGPLLRRPRNLAIVAVGVVLLAALALTGRSWYAQWKACREPSYKPVAPIADVAPLPLEVDDFDLYDLGVVDADQDGNLDLFTANHSAQQSFKLGDGKGGFTDAFDRWRLHQHLPVPGLENSDAEPPFDRTGLYIYVRFARYHVRAHGVSGAALSGSAEMSGRVTFCRKQGDIRQSVVPGVDGGLDTTTVAFRFDRDGLASWQRRPGGPWTVTIDEQVPLDKVYVGRRCVNPESRTFELHLRDRHGLAWHDVDGDGRLDVYITRGGIRGAMARMKRKFHDEMLVLTPEGLVDETLTRRFEKNGARARGAMWVDVDGDRRLDLFVSCTGSPNQLFHQQADGTFVENAAERGLDRPVRTTVAWTDLEPDGDPDLLWAGPVGVGVSVNEGGTFERRILTQTEGLKERGKITLGDFDLDGDEDAFYCSDVRSTLLVNRESGFEVVAPASVGLPSRSLGANWVDQDNDGWPDLHLVPQGVYRGGPDGKFEATDAFRTTAAVLAAVGTWFDTDNDGFRDLLLAVRPPRSPRWSSGLYRSAPNGNHWLQVRLIGPRLNREAIGGRVTVRTELGAQVQSIGSADGSRYGQGHYRLYFGLGAHDGADVVDVHWPDGSVRTLNDVPADQLLEIRYREQEPEFGG